MGLFGKSKGKRVKEANSQLQELKGKIGDWFDNVLTKEKDVQFRENVHNGFLESLRKDIFPTILVIVSIDETVMFDVETRTWTKRWGPFGKAKGKGIKEGLIRINAMIKMLSDITEDLENIPKDEHEWINTELKKLGLTMLNDLYNIKKTLED